MNCKKCSSSNSVKNGFIRGHQRYKCKECGCVYTKTPPRGKPRAMKTFAVVLYTVANASLGMIGRIFGVSTVSVLRWVRKEAQTLSEPKVAAEAQIIQVDEMWHFVNGKKTKFGSGKPMILWKEEWCPGNWVGVMLEPSRNYWTKLESKAETL